jgi:hypothetical protein
MLLLIIFSFIVRSCGPLLLLYLIKEDSVDIPYEFFMRFIYKDSSYMNNNVNIACLYPAFSVMEQY